MAGNEETTLLYQCVKCGSIVKFSELELGVRCPFCRYRVLRKIRPPVVKKVLAR